VEGERVRFEVTPGTPPQGEDGTINRKGGYCLLSGEPMPFDYIRAEGKAGRMGAMLMAIVTEGQGGRSYYSPDAEQSRIAEQASPEWKPLGDIPQQALGFRVQLYGMDEYNKLFTPRQLVALTTFSDLVAEARARAYQDALAAGRPDDPTPLREGGAGALAYAEAVSVYLAFVFDKLVDLSSSLCRWEPVAQCPRGVFARQALPMVWDFAEANPLGKSSGSWQSVLDNFIHNFSRTFQMIGEHHKGVATQQEAQTINIDAATVISTDPPYYDNIGYADLSDFLYIWLRRILRSVYPDIFDTVLVPKDLELIAAPHRHVSKEASNQHFERGMVDTFTNIRRFVRPDYPLSVYYAFKQQEAEESTEDISLDDEETAQTSAKPKVQTASTGWETMLNGLIEAGFTIEGTYPIRTELSNRMIGMGTNALASSIVLVCRPRPAEAPSSGRRAFIAALRAELPAALQALQSGNIAPVDLAQASIGPGMAVYSRYSAVLEADGSPMSVRVALGLINAALDEYLAEQDGQIDPDTRFAVAWFEQFAFGEGEFGLADVLARAKNTSVAGAQAAGLLRAEKGRVALIPWSRYDLKAWNPQTDKRLTIWEVLHYLLNYLHHHGEVGAASLMNKLDTSTATEARQLAYRLYNICERKAWAEQARDYNALVLSWSGIQGEAQRLQAAQGDQIGTNQGLLFTND
jgi:putative DNA methylase